MNKNELILKADVALHGIMERHNAHTETGTLAAEAHGAVHDLAAMLSDDPEIRAIVACDGI